MAEAARALADRAPLAGMEQRTRALMAELADLGTELRTVVETWDDDPERLDAVRSRRQLLHELGRKYGTTPGEIIAFAAEARTRLADLESAEARALALDGEIERAGAAVADAEAVVARRRHQAAPVLADQIESTLRTLAMPSARFEVSVAGDGSADQVTFLLGANPGEPALPMAKVASGGELARTMLAVRLALAGSPGVIVFDEVDAGIGGDGRHLGGRRPGHAGRRTQVLVVTHLAQVAAHADRQIVGRKARSTDGPSALTTELDPRGTGGRVEPDAFGEPRQRHGPAPRPRSCSRCGPAPGLSAEPVAPGDRSTAPWSTRRRGQFRSVSRGARHANPAESLRRPRRGRTIPRRQATGDEVHLRHRRRVLFTGQGTDRFVAGSSAEVPGTAGHHVQARPLYQCRPGDDEPLRARRGLRHRRRRRDRPRPRPLRAVHRREPAPASNTTTGRIYSR